MDERRAPAAAAEDDQPARQLLPLCPEDAAGPIRDALSQVQMLYVREQQGSPPEQAEPKTSEEEERAKARAKIWTPGSP